MAIKAILFDKDGTLIEVNGTWIPLYRDMLAREFGHSPHEIEDLLVRAGYEPQTDSFRAGSMLAGGTTQQIADAWWPQHSLEERCRRIHYINNTIGPEARKFIKPLMNLPNVFDELKMMGFRLGIGTNDSEASGKAHMDHLGVLHYFDIVIGADSVAIPKPSGAMIEFFARETGFEPHEIAMIGDNSHDMEEARRGGAGLAIAVLSGNAKHCDIAHLSDHVIDDIAALPKLFRSMQHVL